MSGKIALDDSAIDQMTEEATNAIAAIVQKKLGIKYGDVAALHFSDTSVRESIRMIVSGYVEAEEMYL